MRTPLPLVGGQRPPDPPAADASHTQQARLLVCAQGLTPAAAAARYGCDVSAARRVLAGVHQKGHSELKMPPNTRRRDFERLVEGLRVGRLGVEARQQSRIDPFLKYVLVTERGERIETVRIPLEKPGRFSVCVSSQVGCGLGCLFCATGRLGLVRSLEPWEIVEQVRIVRQELPAGSRAHGVVFQGMGEPLSSPERVFEAVRVLSDPSCQAIDQKAMTICTAGLPAGIRALGRSDLRVRLGISVGSARSEVRRQIMPIEAKASLEEVLDAAVEHVRRTESAPMLSVTLLKGVNTSDDDALALRSLLLRFWKQSGRAPRLSLIDYNPIGADDPFERATEEERLRFRSLVSDAGFPVIRRYSGGSDVGAACGQLVGVAKVLD